MIPKPLAICLLIVFGLMIYLFQTNIENYFIEVIEKSKQTEQKGQ
jgi:hypothetical protein